MVFSNVITLSLVCMVVARDKPHLPTANGKEPQEKIVNGVEVDPPGKYPWIAMGVDGDGTSMCGGSLVAPNVVLSAAHCNDDLSKFYLGVHDENNLAGAESFVIAEKVDHPNYNSETKDYDYMMVKLNGDSTLTPISLDDGTTETNEGTALIVMGWGATSTPGSYSYSYSNVLLEVEVDVVSNANCNTMYGGDITNQMLCAARTVGGVTFDSCQGDSGGPIINKADEKQVGVVSWGYECANPNYPGVYARVSSVNEWIQSYIDLWSPSSPPSGSPTSGSPKKVIKKKKGKKHCSYKKKKCYKPWKE